MIPAPITKPEAPPVNAAARRRLIELRRRAVNENLDQIEEPGLQTTSNVCLLVTNQLHKAKERCTALVDEIIEDCRRKNRKFRDLEFDIEHDLKRCLNGSPGSTKWGLEEPRGLQRVSDLFSNPSFFKDGVNYGNIHQGTLGDCWVLSALSTAASRKGLVEEFCIKHDAKVGVYGFIFFCDNDWVPVIIDDMLFTSLPKWEELSVTERNAYGGNKAIFQAAMRNGENLEFAKAGEGEQTWVPLIEKAFAKLYGSYRALNYGGEIGEAMETLTGGVNTFIFTKDILDKDRFWSEELMKSNQDRLFGCYFRRKCPPESRPLMVDGLVMDHTYSILRTVQVEGKRFLVIRNPWGSNEWTGPWSDGAKEWTDENGDKILKQLGHKFGDDGQFIMEYDNFLDVWDVIDRTRLFDNSWTMSSYWQTVTLAPKLSPWTFGDVSFTFDVAADTPAIIVLAQADRRFFQEVLDPEIHTFDFVVYRKGEPKAIAFSSHANLRARSVNTELDLQKGSYVVHLRIDRHSSHDRHLSRINTEWTRSCSLASNFDKKKHSRFLPVELNKLAGKDLEELRNLSSTRQIFNENLSASPATTTTALPGTERSKSPQPVNRPVAPRRATMQTTIQEFADIGPARMPSGPLLAQRQDTMASNSPSGAKNVVNTSSAGRPAVQNRYSFHFHHPVNPAEIPMLKSTETLQAATTCMKCMKNGEDHKVCVHEETWEEDEEDDESRFVGQLTIGLRVYTKNQDRVNVQGHLRRNMKFSYVDVPHDS